MAGKRFTLAYADYDWWAICDKDNPTELGISGESVVKLLNELHEENQTLSSQVMLYKSELDVFANQNKKLERQIKEQFDLLIKARKQGFIDF